MGWLRKDPGVPDPSITAWARVEPSEDAEVFVIPSSQDQTKYERAAAGERVDFTFSLGQDAPPKE